MGRIYKRIINGLLISADSSKVTTIKFTASETGEGLPPNNYTIDYYRKDRLLEITYLSGLRNDSFLLGELFKDCPCKCNGRKIIDNGTFSIDVPDVDSIQLKSGTYFLLPTVTINGIEYIRYNPEIQYLHQYLISHNHLSESVCTGVTEKIGSYVAILIKDTDLIEHTGISQNSAEIIEPALSYGDGELYCNFINHNKYNKNIIYARVQDSSVFKESGIKNIQPTPFDNQEMIVKDNTILKQVNEFALNEAKCITYFIKNLRKLWPSIDFYNNDEDINLEYSEHIKYRVHLSEKNRSPIFNSIVHVDEVFGRYQVSTIPIELEYFTQNVPLLIARKDSYKIGKFLNTLRKYKVPMQIKGIDEPLLFQCSLFWERDNMPSDYSTVTTTDNNQWSAFSYPYTCQIICTLLEHKPWIGKPVLNVISKVVVVTGDDIITDVKNPLVLNTNTTTGTDRIIKITDEFGNRIADNENRELVINIEDKNYDPVIFTQLRVYYGNSYKDYSTLDSENSEINEVNWNSENEEIATVNDGTISLTGEKGKTKISCSCEYKGTLIKEEINLTVQ